MSFPRVFSEDSTNDSPHPAQYMTMVVRDMSEASAKWNVSIRPSHFCLGSMSRLNSINSFVRRRYIQGCHRARQINLRISLKGELQDVTKQGTIVKLPDLLGQLDICSTRATHSRVCAMTHITWTRSTSGHFDLYPQRYHVQVSRSLPDQASGLYSSKLTTLNTVFGVRIYFLDRYLPKTSYSGKSESWRGLR